MGDKIIRDSIHGYIEVPEQYMKMFVDTEVFQRLRDIEQTSMKCLYPCARHDRFTHSLGTFYLGRKLINALVKNIQICSSECYEAFCTQEWDAIIMSFELAYLLHDYGHAPFDLDFHELFSRDYKKSVWKSYAEYENLFGFKEPETTVICNNIISRSSEIIESLCQLFQMDTTLSKKESWSIIPAKAKISATKNANIYVQFDNGSISDFAGITKDAGDVLPAFFYLYHSGDALTGNQNKTSLN